MRERGANNRDHEIGALPFTTQAASWRVTKCWTAVSFSVPKTLHHISSKISTSQFHLAFTSFVFIPSSMSVLNWTQLLWSYHIRANMSNPHHYSNPHIHLMASRSKQSIAIVIIATPRIGCSIYTTRFCHLDRGFIRCILFQAKALNWNRVRVFRTWTFHWCSMHRLSCALELSKGLLGVFRIS